jgi:hypothetical protein
MSFVLSHYLILLYPWYLSFCPYMVRGFVCAFSALCGFFFCSNALPISLNVLSYIFTQQRIFFRLSVSNPVSGTICCILTSGLNHYATILAAAATGPEPASLLARGCHRYPTPSSPPTTSFPLLRRARSQSRQQREPVVAASGGGEIKTQWLTLLLSRTCKRGSDQAGA